MEWLVFTLVVVAAGLVGIVAGLAVAPRLTRWTDRPEATDGEERGDAGGPGGADDGGVGGA